MRHEIKLSTSDTHLEKWPIIVAFEGLLGILLIVLSLKITNFKLTQIILLFIAVVLISLFVMHLGVYMFKKKYVKVLASRKRQEILNGKKREKILLGSGGLSSWQFSTKARILKFDENSARLLGTKQIYYTFEELENNLDIKRIIKKLEEDNLRIIDDEVYFPELKKWFIVRGRCVDSDVKLNPNQFIGIMFDNTERRNHLKQMEILSTTDELTGLKNRRYLFEIFQKELNHYTRLKKVFTVAIFDLDFFKKINDTWGHLAGDHVLVSFSKIIQDEVRPYDLVARFGGEEFVVLFPDINKKKAYDIVNRLKKRVSETICMFEGRKIPYTFSCGIGDASELGLYTEKEFITIIDTRLYEAKHSGRNLIVSGG